MTEEFPVEPLDLKEMLREAERVVDHQIEAIKDLDRKSEQMTGLGVAALAGGLALGAFTLQQFPNRATVLFAVLLGLGVLANGVSLLLLVHAYVGFRSHPEAHVGVDLHWLVEKSVSPQWDLQNHYVHVLAAFPRFYEWNLARMRASARSRQLGLYLLSASVGVDATAFFYVLGGLIN